MIGFLEALSIILSCDTRCPIMLLAASVKQPQVSLMSYPFMAATAALWLVSADGRL